MKAPLTRLGLERGLPLMLALGLLVGLPIWSLAGGGNFGTPTGVVAMEAAQTTGLGRMGVWSGISSFLLFVAIWRGSRAGARFAKADRLWLSVRVDKPLASALYLVIGAMLSVALSLGALGLGLEFALPSNGAEASPAFLKSRALPGQDLVVLDASSPASMETAWILEDPSGQLNFEGGAGAAPHLLFVPGTLAGDGPSALLTATATRTNETGGLQQSTTTTQRIRGATQVLLPVPPGTGDLIIRLTHGGEGPPVQLTQARSGLLLPRSSDKLASFALWQRATLWIGGAIALALGLGSALGSTLGLLLTLALQLFGFEAYLGGLFGGLPWVEALTTTGEGFIPPFAGLDSLSGCLLQLAVGTLLLARGIRTKSFAGSAR